MTSFWATKAAKVNMKQFKLKKQKQVEYLKWEIVFFLFHASAYIKGQSENKKIKIKN